MQYQSISYIDSNLSDILHHHVLDEKPHFTVNWLSKVNFTVGLIMCVFSPMRTICGSLRNPESFFSPHAIELCRQELMLINSPYCPGGACPYAYNQTWVMGNHLGDFQAGKKAPKNTLIMTINCFTKMNKIITIDRAANRELQWPHRADKSDCIEHERCTLACWLAGWIGQQAGEVTAQLFCPLPPDIEPSFPHKSPCPSLSTLER